MMPAGSTSGRSRPLVLAAMIVAVSMTFIDQTIVSIAVPQIQRELHLSSTGTQWAVNAYLLALAALFAFGGKLADTFGHRRLVTIGVLVFAGASTLCGLTPTGAIPETWIVAFRALQGAGGALMFPAALAIVVQTFELRQRGRALALFFGVAGALTAIGPIAGGYLTEWTWRAIFWVNVPVALVALVLVHIARPETAHKRTSIDYRGLTLLASGIALSIFGFQQSAIWGFGDPVIEVSIAVGLALLVAFYRFERRASSPLVTVGIFTIRPFFVENLVLLVASLTFIPVFFFASEYAQISLDQPARTASLVLLYFFIGYAAAAQIGGRMLDRIGAKRPVVLGCVLAAVGFWQWGDKMPALSLHSQLGFIILAGAGMGLMIGQANTDAVNRASRFAYGEATGITQTVRSYAAGLGLAILGTILVSELRSRLTSSLLGLGIPHATAASEARQIAQFDGAASTASIPHFVRLDYATASRTVFLVMAAILAVAGVVAVIGLQRGRQEASVDATAREPGRQLAQVGQRVELRPAARTATAHAAGVMSPRTAARADDCPTDRPGSPRGAA